MSLLPAAAVVASSWNADFGRCQHEGSSRNALCRYNASGSLALVQHRGKVPRLFRCRCLGRSSAARLMLGLLEDYVTVGLHDLFRIDRRRNGLRRQSCLPSLAYDSRAFFINPLRADRPRVGVRRWAAGPAQERGDGALGGALYFVYTHLGGAGRGRLTFGPYTCFSSP